MKGDIIYIKSTMKGICDIQNKRLRENSVET